ncbi:MAG: hypothetical protein HY912_15120 [Desulfomonile tiedjei]|uniref:Uncharacterized protein n=1 Tax=Desulfomonile tiedjei TaxID=2358 RepID=A0A9D6V3F9_9BACT|nr:hypothetical protein [Desulfomonile tiedjei]
MGKVTRILFAVTVLNFGVWGTVNSVIHGDAINGKIELRKYYGAMKGRYTEVSPGVYLYSFVHKCPNFVLFPATNLWGLLGMRTNAPKGKRDRTADHVPRNTLVIPKRKPTCQ